MLLKLVFVILTAVGTLGEETDEYVIQALDPVMDTLDGLSFDGPKSISNAPTTIQKNELPTLEQLMYYNYYSAAMYYPYGHANLSCEYCLKFKDDVNDHKVLNNNVHNTIALVTLSKTRQEIVVAIRGSMNVWNFLLDASLISGSNSNTPKQIKLHRGFFIAAMSLYEDVIRTVASYLKDNRRFKVVITGHSLGAAIARIFYFFLNQTNQFPKLTYELYTYGEPRVGNEYFADFMNSQPITSARVVSRGDMASHFPPTSMVGTKLPGAYYVHPHTEFWINGKKFQKFCRRIFYEDPKCSMSLGPKYSFVDHFVYFDTNLGSIFDQPLVFASLPLNLFNPAQDVPPLPKKIENLGVGGKVIAAVYPNLG